MLTTALVVLQTCFDIFGWRFVWIIHTAGQLMAHYIFVFQSLAGKASVCQGCPGQYLCSQQGILRTKSQYFMRKIMPLVQSFIITFWKLLRWQLGNILASMSHDQSNPRMTRRGVTSTNMRTGNSTTHSCFILIGWFSWCAVPENIDTPPTEFSFLFRTPLPPRNSSLASYFASKILAFRTPFPLGISNNLPWGGLGFFLEVYTISTKTKFVKRCQILIKQFTQLQVAVQCTLAKSTVVNNWFMLSVRTSSYGCTREVWGAREKCKSCSRRSREQL